MTLPVHAVADYQLLFESAPALLLVLNPQLEIIAASNAYLQATLTRRSDVIGRHIFDVFPDNPDDPQADGSANLRASLENVIKHRRPDTMPVQKYDVRRAPEAGGAFEERYWSPVNSPVLDTEGRLVCIIHRAEDVTDFVHFKQRREQIDAGKTDINWVEREAEQFQRSQELAAANRQLKRLTATLELVNKELESFSYSVSHDLRAPLRAIDSFASMLEARAAERLDDEDRRLLDIIHNSSRNMAQLIDDLLRLSRVSTTPLTSRRVDMRALAQEAWQQVGTEFAGEIALEDLPEAWGDAGLLRQVWINLLGNAVKYSAGKGADARIRVSTDSDDTGHVYHVQDNGAGFDMRRADRMFQAFQRLHSGEEFAGSGVGLAIVHCIVNRHEGRLWAEGAVGHGAALHFHLPIFDSPSLLAEGFKL